MYYYWIGFVVFFFFQAEDGIRDLVRSRGLGDVYKRQALIASGFSLILLAVLEGGNSWEWNSPTSFALFGVCLLYTSDAADERSSVDLGGRRIIKKKSIIDLRQSCR